MSSIELVKASNGSSNASVATVQNIRSPGSSTITVDTVAGINPAGFTGSMGTPHTFTDPVTSETITVISEATAVDFAGHVAAGNIEIDTIAPGYTDLGSAVGDIVIIRPTTQWSDNVAAILETSLNDDGTLQSNVVTSAKIANANVTAAKMVNAGVFTGDAVSTFPALTIGSGAITTGKLATASVTPDKLSTGASKAVVDTSESTSSTSYTDLSTVGPSVTVTIGANGLAIVMLSCSTGNDTANGQTLISFVVSGANTRAATDTECIKYTQVSGGGELACSQVFLLSGLSAGSTTFKMQYRAGSHLGIFENRNIAVVPL